MRSHAIAVFFAFVVVADVARPAEATVAWKVDVGRSHATFEIRHVIVETVRGSVPIREGRMTTATSDGAPTALETTLDPHGIDTGIAERDGALRGADYFDVARFPTWTFVTTSIEAGEPFTIHGLLTLHGTTRPVTLSAQERAPIGNDRHFVATTVIDRHDFIAERTNADGLIGSHVRVDLDEVFVREPPP